MALIKREMDVNGKTYALLLPPARPAMMLTAKTTVLVGPLLGALKSVKDAYSGNDESQKQAVLLSKLGEVLAQVDPVKLDAVMMEAVSISHLCCNNEPISSEIGFEKHFSEHRAEVYQVCLWTLWECVRDFFPGLSGASLQGIKTAVNAFQSPTAGQQTTG